MNGAINILAVRLSQPVPAAVFISAERVYAGTARDVDRDRVTRWTEDALVNAEAAARTILALAARWGVAGLGLTNQ